jgi:hypothetical protein
MSTNYAINLNLDLDLNLPERSDGFDLDLIC